MSYVLDTKYEKAFETDVHRRLLFAFRDNRIMPPAIGPASWIATAWPIRLR